MKTFMTTLVLGILAAGLAGCKVQTGDVTNGGGKPDAPAATESVAPAAPTESTTAK